MSKTPSHPRYRIVETLARGGMGTVCLAEDLLEHGRRVALKTYPASTPVELLRREFLTLRRLRHPGIARASHFGVCRRTEQPFYAMEYLEGTPLGAWSKQLESATSRNPSARCAALVGLFAQAASATAHLHRHRLLHLDLKPSNLMVLGAAEAGASADGALLVLIDFGLVRVVGDEAGVTRGTLPYMAPELLQGEPPDARTDIFALGATLFHVLTRRVPFAGSTAAQVLRAQRAGVSSCEGIPAALDRIIGRCLARDPANRFADADALLDALRRVHDELRAGVELVLPRPEEVDLVGRETLQRQLEAWLESPRRAGTLRVLGASGMGKTRVLEEIATALEVRGRPVALCRGAESALALARQAVWRAAAEKPPGASEARAAPLVFSASGLVPEIATSGRHAARAHAPAIEGGPHRTVIRQAVSWLAGRIRDGLFLLVDDIDRCGPEGIAFVRALARDAATRGGSARARGGLVLTASDPQIEVEGPRYELDALDRKALSRWLELLGDERLLAPRLVRRLHQRTRGVPLLIAWETGHVLREGARGRGAAKEPASSAAAERMRRDLAALDAARVGIIETLALAERPLAPRALAAMTGLERSEVARNLRLLEASGLLHLTSDGTPRFTYAPFRDAARGGLEPARRRELHARLAALEATSPIERVARSYHLFRAGDVAAALDAATAACEVGPFDPLRHASLTISVLELAASSRAADATARLRFTETLADRLQESGRPAEAAKRWSALLSRSKAVDSATRVRLRRKLAHARYLTGDVARAEKDLRQCLETLPARTSSEDRLAIIAELAIIAHYRQDGEGAAEWARRGIDTWRRRRTSRRSKRSQRQDQSAARHAVHLHGILGQVAIRRFHFTEAARTLEAGERLAREHGLVSSLLLNNLGLAYHLDSRLADALAVFRRARTSIEEVADETARVAVVCNMAQIHAKMGRFRDAESALDEIRGSPLIEESSRLRLGMLYSETLVAALMGREATPAWDAVETLARKVGDGFLAGFAAVYGSESSLLRGDASGALAALERARAGAAARGDRDAGEVMERYTASRLALALALAGDTKAAAAELARDNAPPRDALDAWTQTWRGLALRELARVDDSVRCLRDARDFFHEARIVPGLVEATLCLADAALACGDRRDASRLMEEARRDIARCRMSRGGMRLSAVRLPLLEARLAPHSIAHREDVSEGLAHIEDLLARAEGEPAFCDLTAAVETAACARLALARLRGGAQEIRQARERLAVLRARRDGPPLPEQQAMVRAGLGEFTTPDWIAATTELRPAAVDVIEGLIELPVEAGCSEAELAALLEQFTTPLDSVAAALWSVDDTGRARALAAWPERKAGSLRARDRRALPPIAAASRPHELPAAVLAAAASKSARQGIRVVFSSPLFSGSRRVGWLLVASRRADATLGDLRFLRALARALSPRAAAASERASPARRGASGEPPELDDAATAALTETRALGTRTRGAGAEPAARRLPRAGSGTAATSIVATSPVMQRVMKTLESVAASDVTVLLTGESGTGKDALARTLHRMGPRAQGPFIVQAVGSIPPALFEADLFGHTRGAFTGADRTRSGFLLQAQGGTFLFDEIADAEPAVQNKLLRLLEERQVRPVGARESVTLDVRFVATSQADLATLTERGDFRADLYFRLRGVEIVLPPLRERPEDILPLCRHFLERAFGFVPAIPAAVKRALVTHAWPGNVRELRGFVQRLSIGDAPGESLRLRDVEEALGPRSSASPITPDLLHRHSYEELARDLELAWLRHLFQTHRGDLDAIARRLDSSTRSVYRRFERLGLRPKDLMKEFEEPDTI